MIRVYIKVLAVALFLAAASAGRASGGGAGLADSSGRATIELYNNSSCRSIVVSAEGMTPDGRAVVYK